MLGAHQIDLLVGAPAARVETTISMAANGVVNGTTTVEIAGRWRRLVVGARVLALDHNGAVLGFTGEQVVRVGGRMLPFWPSRRVLEWSSALFADSLAGLARLEVLHYRHTRRRVADRLADRRARV